MAEEDDTRFVITKPGVLAFGEDLPAGSNITTFFQDETIVHMSCGRDHSAVVCESGRVYTFGKNQDNGWIGYNVDGVSGPKHVATLSTVKIAQAACGRQYTVFLTDKGELYSCGLNDQGQLGLGHKDKVPVPVLVTGLPPIKKVAAEVYHTMVLTNSGEVWGCGHNGHGQLGLGHTNHQTSFTQVPNLTEAIIDISCGGNHTALITASQVILVTGLNKNGQLGLGGDKPLTSFKPVSVPTTAIATVSCGTSHTVALRVDGTSWAWGYNEQGQLGTGTTDSKSTPTKVIGLQGQTVSQVIAGCHHTAVLTQEGDVWVCGRGKSGELGLGYQNLSTATLLPKSPELVVKQMAFAGRYSLLLVVPSDTKPAPQVQIGVTEEGDPVRSGVTDWEASLLKSLECPVCLKVMCAPILLCVKGHNLCGACRSDPSITACPLCREGFTEGRNVTLEGLSEVIPLPCTECLQRMPASGLEKHGEVCPQRKYGCPVDGRCGWRGRPHTMLTHAATAHPHNTWADLPHVFVHTTAVGLAQTDVLSAHGQVFTLHRRYDRAANTFQAALRYIGPPENTHKFKIKFTVISDNMKNSYTRNVSSDIEEMYRSANCVSMKSELLDSFLQRGLLVCRVAILLVGANDLADYMKALPLNTNE